MVCAPTIWPMSARPDYARHVDDRQPRAPADQIPGAGPEPANRRRLSRGRHSTRCGSAPAGAEEIMYKTVWLIHLRQEAQRLADQQAQQQLADVTWQAFKRDQALDLRATRLTDAGLVANQSVRHARNSMPLPLRQVPERQGGRRFDGLDREIAADIADTGKLEQGAKQKPFVGGQIRHHDLQQEIGSRPTPGNRTISGKAWTASQKLGRRRPVSLVGSLGGARP